MKLRNLLEKINPNIKEARQLTEDMDELERRQNTKRRQLDARLKAVEYAITPYLEKLDEADRNNQPD